MSLKTVQYILPVLLTLIVSCSKEQTIQSFFEGDPYPTKIYMHCAGTSIFWDQDTHAREDRIPITDDIYIEKVSDFKKKRNEPETKGWWTHQFGIISFDSMPLDKFCINVEDETGLLFHPSCDVSSFEEKNCNGTHSGHFNKVTGYLYYLEECNKPYFKKHEIEYTCKIVDPVVK